MKINKTMAVIVFISVITSFLYGVVTVSYKIFPYEQLRTIKKIVNPNPTPHFSDKYHHRKSFFEQHGRHGCDAVFIGDSITEGAEWSELFPSLKIANRGIGGDRSDGVLKRLDSVYSTSAKKAFIMIGINDFAKNAGVKTVFDNYKEIVKKLVANGMKVYVQSTILAGKRRKDLNPKIVSLNDRLKKLADETESVTYIDLNVGLKKGPFLNPQYSRDDVHLNGYGYNVWKNLIKDYLL